MEKMLKHLKDWQEYVSIPRKSLDGFPICPFAKTEKIDFELIKSEEELLIQILYKERSGSNLFFMVDSNTALTSDSAESLVKFYNSISTEYQYFIDDFNNPQTMNGIDTGNGKYIIIIAQKKDILEKSRDSLRKTDYYKFLGAEYLKKIGVIND